MTAAVVATITAPQMIRGGENHQPAIKIKVAGQDFWWRNAARLGAMKFHHARPANAGFIPQIRRDLRDEFVGFLLSRTSTALCRRRRCKAGNHSADRRVGSVRHQMFLPLMNSFH